MKQDERQLPSIGGIQLKPFMVLDVMEELSIISKDYCERYASRGVEGIHHQSWDYDKKRQWWRYPANIYTIDKIYSINPNKIEEFVETQDIKYLNLLWGREDIHKNREDLKIYMTDGKCEECLFYDINNPCNSEQNHLLEFQKKKHNCVVDKKIYKLW